MSVKDVGALTGQNSSSRTLNFDSVPANTSFIIEWTDNSLTYSQEDGVTFGTKGWFNSIGSEKNINATLEGSNEQRTLIAWINFTNYGNTTEQFLVTINETLPVCMTLFGGKDNSPHTNTFTIDTSWYTVNSSVLEGQSEECWVWLNTTSCITSDNTLFQLQINSTTV